MKNQLLKQISIVAMLFAITTAAFAQLKINQYGNIGLGIAPRTDNSYKLMVKGNLLLTTYPEIPPDQHGYGELRFLLNNGGNHAEIGSNTHNIVFWYSSPIGYNDLYAHKYYAQAFIHTGGFRMANPGSLNALEKITKLNPIKIGNDSSANYGFSGQEIATLFPSITKKMDSDLFIDYNQMIPILVSALKEEHNKVDSLQNKLQQVDSTSLDSIEQQINDLKNQLAMCCSKCQNNLPNNPNGASILYQNAPNPFSTTTIIRYKIVGHFSSASIMIFDMSGALEKTYEISPNSDSPITISGSEFAAGMYLYSLIVDGKQIDTKQMILTR